MRPFLYICLVMLAACDPGNDVPEGLLDRETFKDLLTEAQLIEARLNREMVVDQRKQVPMHLYYEEAFEAQGIDREQFERTFDHYSSRPQELKAIYEEIITELSRRKDQMPIRDQGDTAGAPMQAIPPEPEPEPVQPEPWKKIVPDPIADTLDT